MAKNEPLEYCVRCGQMVPGNKKGEGQHSKLVDGVMVPCK